MTSSAKPVAMIGLGRMGLPMAQHISGAGYEVVAFDVSEPARARAAEAGLSPVASVPELADRRPDLICTSLPATEQVEATYFGPTGDGAGGLAGLLAVGAICVDLSTISISASRVLGARCAEIGLRFLDAPVSGTSIHAEAGSLVVMVGGEETAFEAARPVLSTFASRVERVGDNGAGLKLKLITNRLLTTHLAAIAEAVVSLEATELSVGQALELLASGAIPRLLDYKGAPLAERDYRPQFTIDLMAKDLRLADEDLRSTPLASSGRDIVDAAAAAGYGDDDLAAIIEIVQSRYER